MTNFDLRQEADYVLGMMDLYNNDDEIRQLLHLKGLSTLQIQEVLSHAKHIRFQKRVRQSYRIMLIGVGIAAIMGPAWYFLNHSGMYNSNDAAVQRVYSGNIIDLAMYGFFAGVVQLIFRINRYITYKMKLNKLSN